MLDRSDSGPPSDHDDCEPRRRVSSERETVADPMTRTPKRSRKQESADDHHERDKAERLQALILADISGRMGQRSRVTPESRRLDTSPLTMPGSLDGAKAAVLDESGRRVASCPLDDQRVIDEASGDVVGRVFGIFEEADPEWAESLARASGALMSITLVLPNDERFDGVQALPPEHDFNEPLHAIYFPLEHPDF